MIGGNLGGTIGLGVAVATVAYGLLVSDPSPQSMIASTDVREVCATDGLPGSAYSRQHRVVARRSVPGYQWDHIASLCLGGADNDANVWLQPIEEALLKDQLEREVCKAVCSGQMSLAEGQRIFLSGVWRQRIGR